jgi:hypothetical protein
MTSPFVSENVQLKYSETGRERDCLPRVGQWNMMNKVIMPVLSKLLSTSCICSLLTLSQALLFIIIFPYVENGQWW